MPDTRAINVKINPEQVPLETDQGILDSEEKKWGMPLKEVYKHGVSFYKDKDGKAVHLSYEDRLKLVAYTQQTVHGPLDTTSASPLGVLDVIGRDRRAAWQALGHMSQIQAMAGFVHILDRLCPLFKPYLEAIQKDYDEKRKQELKKQEEEKAHIELQNRIMLENEKQQSNKVTEEQQVQRIKDALNEQTYDQFLQYAQQQYPGNFDQQAVLIRQLQDQHYQQYIQQLAVDRRLANSNITQSSEVPCDDIKEKQNKEKDLNLNESFEQLQSVTDNKSMQTSAKTIISDIGDETKEEDSDGDDIFPPIEEARMWTSGDIVVFKETAAAGGGKLTVSHGETVTIRVPTHERARCLCWEFASDHYDIGFGLYFEWSKSHTSEVTIHVSETDEEDDGEDDVYGDEEFVQTVDPEIGVSESAALHGKPAVSVVVPIYRRDSHTEVYAGSHTYPGEGVYLLKFDNTYSLWRSKSIYYKVYYTE